MSEIQKEKWPNVFDFRTWSLRGKLLALVGVPCWIILTTIIPLYFNRPFSIGGFPELWVATNVVGWTWLILAWIIGFGVKR
jgi:hypothetical protein